MKLTRSEAQEQQAVVQYCDLKHIPIFHIPNEGKRTAKQGYYAKLNGLKAGVPDLMIPVARNGYHGMFIEMKVGKNKTSEKQKEWIFKLRENGYLVKVCYGADDAIHKIINYMYLERL